MNKRNVEAMLRRSVALEIDAILIAFTAKWAAYLVYMKHSCERRTLHASWKDANFCVNSGELRMWEGIGYVEVALAVLFAATIIAWLLSQFLDGYRETSAK